MLRETIWTLKDLTEEERKDAIDAGAKEDEEYWGDPCDPRQDIFYCKFCNKKMTTLDDCEHRMFVYDGINDDYLDIKEEFEILVFEKLSKLGIKVESLPKFNGDYDENDREIKPFDELFPELDIQSYVYYGNKHGGWGFDMAFMDLKKKQAKMKGGKS